MFGSRLKTWMENYIGLPRKKESQKEKSKRNDGGGIIVESSESLACSDTGVSFSSQQILSSSTADNKEGYSTTTMESERSGMTHCHTAVSLPSPESAYSTGYSTDGASPGEAGPPEYYINIRTGKHYFPSPAPTPTSPHPDPDPLQPRPPAPPRLPPHPPPPPAKPPPALHTLTAFPGGFPPHPHSSSAEPPHPNALSASEPHYFGTLHFSKSPCKKSSPISQLTPIKLFLKSPKHEKGKPKSDLDKTPTAANNKKPNSGGKPKKWFKQPFQKFGHRRTDSCDEVAVRSTSEKVRTQQEKNFRYVLPQENSASPRQRNRIKTNPWLPTEPVSAHYFHLTVGFSPGLTRNRSCSNTPLQNRKAGQSNARSEESKSLVKKPEAAGNRQAGGKLPTELSDHSEEDLTLNEVMGTYDESYVYEKETDILSDSDPTDCEDYGTDSEADNGGDERDSHDDELDFIDNGSLYECEDDLPKNTGRCTYHDVKKNSFVHKGDRRKLRKDSECRRNSRKDQDLKMRRDKRRQARKSLRDENEERRKIHEEKVKANALENGRGSNLSKVLAQRILARKASKSAEGTPITARRQEPTAELRETHIGSDEARTGERRPDDVVLIDFETDLKYNELMKEAEHMFQSMRNSPVIKARKQVLGFAAEEEKPRKPDRSADVSTKAKAEQAFRREKEHQATPARKSPKELQLKLSAEAPRKPKRLHFDGSERSSFRTRSSAHSPLDPLGPALRHFAVFSPPRRDGKASASSSEDSEPRGASGRKGCAGGWSGAPGSPAVPVAFQALDLGKAPAPYCPQSEPVKRKIYSCSKTYDKLVKQFENKQTIFEDTRNGQLGSSSLGTKGRDSSLETCLHGNQGHFPRERRREGEKIPPGGGILRRPPSAPARPCAAGKPQRRPPDSDVLR